MGVATPRSVLSRPRTPRKVLKSIQKSCARRAKRKKKKTQLPTHFSGFFIWTVRPSAVHPPPGLLLGRYAACWVDPRAGDEARCLTTTHSASPLHRRRSRTLRGPRRRAKPEATAKRPGRWRELLEAPARGAAEAPRAPGRRAWVLEARSPRGCPSALAAGTTATRRRSRATSASACGGTASARNAA